jgi:hypothetical protein
VDDDWDYDYDYSPGDDGGMARPRRIRRPPVRSEIVTSRRRPKKPKPKASTLTELPGLTALAGMIEHVLPQDGAGMTKDAVRDWLGPLYPISLIDETIQALERQHLIIRNGDRLLSAARFYRGDSYDRWCPPFGHW